MGRDKALLPWGDGTVLDAVTQAVLTAVGEVVLVAPEGRYAGFGGRVINDRRPEMGPLAGIESALEDSEAEWTLVVACDMPRLTGDWLSRLLVTAERCDFDCVVPATGDGRLHPLAAVYHRRCLPVFAAALAEGTRRVLDAVGRVRVMRWPVAAREECLLANVNTAEEWQTLLQSEGEEY
jgi:molybdopterin-guanine dinucleotide biosynthesis protein A